MEMILAPSILAADFTKVGEQMKETEREGAQYIHFDVMDGKFVPSISFGMPVLASIRNAVDQIFDVHLMIEEPIRYVEEFQKAGADIITVHLEACSDVKATLEKIKACGAKAAISICPDTPVAELEPYVELVDMVLIMSVHPGFGGQSFIPSSLEKIRETRALLDRVNSTADIEVDGGIYTTNVREVLEAGANVIVAGSAIFRGDAAENTKNMMEILRAYE